MADFRYYAAGQYTGAAQRKPCLCTCADAGGLCGRIAVGRVHRGTLKEGMNMTLVKRNGDMFKSKIKELHVFEGLGRVKTNEVSSHSVQAFAEYVSGNLVVSNLPGQIHRY